MSLFHNLAQRVCFYNQTYFLSLKQAYRIMKSYGYLTLFNYIYISS